MNRSICETESLAPIRCQPLIAINPMAINRSILWGGVAVCMLGIGCGQGNVPVYKTTAAVRMDGEGFGPCTLFLHPVGDSKGTRSATGTVEKDGTVVFTTYKVGDGVPQGEFKVTVRSNLTGAPPKPIPADYQSEAKTPLRLTVNAGPTNEAAFDLESKKGAKADTAAASMSKAFSDPSFSAGSGNTE
jgi:hypothetical protein